MEKFWKEIQDLISNMWLILLTQSNLSCLMTVPNFKILGQVVPEKSLTEKKFTDRGLQTMLQKKQKLNTPYILRMPGV